MRQEWLCLAGPDFGNLSALRVGMPFATPWRVQTALHRFVFGPVVIGVAATFVLPVGLVRAAETTGLWERGRLDSGCVRLFQARGLALRHVTGEGTARAQRRQGFRGDALSLGHGDPAALEHGLKEFLLHSTGLDMHHWQWEGRGVVSADPRQIIPADRELLPAFLLVKGKHGAGADRHVYHGLGKVGVGHVVAGDVVGVLALEPERIGRDARQFLPALREGGLGAVDPTYLSRFVPDLKDPLNHIRLSIQLAVSEQSIEALKHMVTESFGKPQDAAIDQILRAAGQL